MLKLYNTLYREEPKEFIPISGSKVNFFVCGPTVYDYSHIGHAKTYIQMDTLARVLKMQNYEVFYLQNITDIDDKIIARAQEQQIDWKTLSKDYEKKYLEDMRLLGIESVTKYAKATDYIDDVIRQVKILLDKGHAYEIDDGVYFEINTFSDYGKLSRRTKVQENDAQTRIDHSSQKRGWNDFCLWKFSKPDEPVWGAPFGPGRPGWHIEDTAITEHFFGSQYDIHGGAIDLIFPHHEAEITQMEAASGKNPFVRFWTHVAFLNIDGKRMGKSLQNFYTIREVVNKGYEPMAIRLFMHQSHYRSSIDFSWANLKSAQNRLNILRAFADLRWQPKEIENTVGSLKSFLAGIQYSMMEEMLNDINTPQALKWLSKAVDQIRVIPSNNIDDFNEFLEFVDNIFGLDLIKSNDLNTKQKGLLKARQQARDKKDWAASDKLRDIDLANQGIGLHDRAYGQIWYRLNVVQ